MKRFLSILLLLISTPCIVLAQMNEDAYKSQKMQVADNGGVWGRDTAKTEVINAPYGIFQWTIDPLLGNVVKADNNDTITVNFQNWKMTDGMTGDYSYLGNTGSPRLNRIFMDRERVTNLALWQPYDYVIGNIQDFRFSNTLSPLTNIAYHSCGGKSNGEDRIRANFATNINKVAGVGFKIDYDYGRGYYNNDMTSLLTGCVYGYYRGDRYNMHAYLQSDRVKQGVMGGIESDDYIENPQKFGRSFSSDDIPANLQGHFYSNYSQTYYLSQRYNWGYDKELALPDSIVDEMPADSLLLRQMGDSIYMHLQKDTLSMQLALDSLKNDWLSKQEREYEFVPIMSFIHTFELNNQKHQYYSSGDTRNFYTDVYYGDREGSHDDNNNLMSMRNTLGVSMREGFKPWAKFNLTVFASHEYLMLRQNEWLRFDNPEMGKRSEHRISVGGQLYNEKNEIFNYGAKAEFWVLGYGVGDFKVDGKLGINVSTKKDTLNFNIKAQVETRKPSIWMESYHSKFAWWDNDLKKEFNTRIIGEMNIKRSRTKLRVGWENLTNYAYYAMNLTPKDDREEGSNEPTDFTRSVRVMQHGGSVQVIMAQLCQDVVAGPWHWENELTYQYSSNRNVLPLPMFNAYSNMYLKFRIAKVLNVQLGADVRFFTKYYAPDYATAIGQFAVQDTKNHAIEIGNYPIVNVYVNLFLKRCRLYVNAAHINAGQGKMYLAPHYPINPMTINFGLSWNFLN